MEAKYPAAVYNIKSVNRWVKANAEKYGIDTPQIAVSGCTAGGHLAALVGLTNGVPLFDGDHGHVGWSSAVKAIIDIDGVIDFMAPCSLNRKRQPNLPDVEWLGGTFEAKPVTWKEASPIFYASDTTAVPILFLNSGFSRFHAGQDELIGMMKEWGDYYEVDAFEIKMHPFWLFHPWVDKPVDLIAALLRRVYKNN
ncbi:MAG: alpha/beta hydrolase [Flavisolibacter sp.]|nr:alpha/beta hydrolase [Flavisolibacter sp.]